MLNRPPAARGFTLVEALVALAIVGLVCAGTTLTFSDTWLKARRVEALTALLQLQSAQERHRAAGNAGYGGLNELGFGNALPNRHYAIELAALGSAGYVATATAQGLQRADAACRVLRLAVQGAQVNFASGADRSVANADTENRRCWNQ